MTEKGRTARLLSLGDKKGEGSCGRKAQMLQKERKGEGEEKGERGLTRRRKKGGRPKDAERGRVRCRERARVLCIPRIDAPAHHIPSLLLPLACPHLFALAVVFVCVVPCCPILWMSCLSSAPNLAPDSTPPHTPHGAEHKRRNRPETQDLLVREVDACQNWWQSCT